MQHGDVVQAILLAFALVVGSFQVGLHRSPSGGHDRWSNAPPMRIASTDHTATLLRDGRVLLTGGLVRYDLPPVIWTQVYDPRSRSWSFGPRMHVGRIGGTATLLADGRVLVAGGLGSRKKAVASVEILDLQQGRSAVAAPLPAARFSQSATLLTDGRVLLVGGVVGGQLSRSTLLYDPQINRWIPGPSTTVPHALQTAITLPSGHILVAGGYGTGAEEYDPTRDSWSLFDPTAPRTGSVVTLLADGTVLMASGLDGAEHDVSNATIFDPATNRWTATGSLATARNAATGTLLPTGDVLVSGGGQVNGHVLRSSELYHPTTHSWSSAAPMHSPRNVDSATLMHDGTVLVCGGLNRKGILDSCEQYRP